MAPQWVTTEDGSLSCFNEETGELYHNRAGAYTEALMNYLEPSAALEHVARTGELRVLDVCFGLGYNTWVLLNELLKDPPSRFFVSVLALENDPEILSVLPHVLKESRFYPLKKIGDALGHNIDYRTQDGPFRFTMAVTENQVISLEIRCSDLRKEIPKLTEPVDRIFHDPFSPNKVMELWTVDLFREYYRLLQPTGGAMLTYSIASAVLGGLRDAGFEIMRTQAVGRKTGGTLAKIPNVPLSQNENWNRIVFPISKEDEEKLSKRAGIPYRDPLFEDSREQIANRRIQDQKLFGLSEI